MFTVLNADADMENLSIDSTSCKVHQNSNGGKKAEEKAVGRSKSGLNTKVHTIVDGLGNPVAFLLSPGNDHNCRHDIPLPEKVASKVAASSVTRPAR